MAEDSEKVREGAYACRPVYLKNEQIMIEAEARIRDLWVLCQQVANFPAHSGSQYDAPVFRFVDGVLPQAIQELSGVLKINFSTLLAGFSRIEQAMKSALAEDNDEITKAEGERCLKVIQCRMRGGQFLTPGGSNNVFTMEKKSCGCRLHLFWHLPP